MRAAVSSPECRLLDSSRRDLPDPAPFATHGPVLRDLRELMGLCDRMLVLSKGTLAGEVARPDFDEEAILAMAYALRRPRGTTSTSS